MSAKGQIHETLYERGVYVLLAIALLIGVGLIFLSTNQGVGVGGDATIYMTSAKNLAAGKGLGLIEADGSFRLLPYSAPFFPIVLSIFENTRSSSTQIARSLNIWLFAALILLIGISARTAARSKLICVGAALLVTFSPILTPVFSWAMAEPLTLVLGFGGLFGMAMLTKYPDSRELLVCSALLTGLAFLTRYSAAAFVAAAGLGWLMFSNTAWKSKLIRGAAFGAIALIPMGVWVLAQFAFTSGVAARTLEDSTGMAGRLASFWPQAGDVLLSWLLPASWIEAPFYPRLLNTLLILIFAGALIVLAVNFFRNRNGENSVLPREGRPQGPRPTGDIPKGRNSFSWIWPALVGMFILFYLTEIFVVYLTTYPPITLDNRMFSPVHVGVLILAPLFLERVFVKRRNALWRFAPLAIIFALAAWYGWRDVRIVNQNYAEGLGYNSAAWRSSELIEWVKHSPLDAKIVTNETMALLYLTGRTAYPLAEIYADRPQDVNARYGSLPADEGQRVFDAGAPLVLFNSIASQLESIYGDQTARRLEALTTGLDVGYQAADGAVYYAPGK